MKLFTIGPAQMYPEIINVRNSIVPYFRTHSFSESMFYIAAQLKNCMNAPDDAFVIPLTASGTGAMEATIVNCFSNKDKLLIINGGTFGKRFCDLCRLHNIKYDAIEMDFGETLTPNSFDRFESKTYTAVLVNLHETSTGQLYDIQIISDFCKRNEILLIVDAISTFLCDPYDMEKYGIDATIISSQKGLCCSPGISFVVMSNRLNQYRKARSQSVYSYFDFDECLLNMERGQTPFTPAVGVLLEIQAMLKKIEKEGVLAFTNKVKENAEYFRKRIHQMNASIPSYPLSNAITPVIFEKPIAHELFEYLAEEKKIYVNPCGGKMADKMIRVAHIGDISMDDHEELITEIKKYLEVGV